jgi:hypothetical protein
MPAKKSKKKSTKPKKGTRKTKQASAQPKRSTLNWLLDSDPAIRWQVMRDLAHEPADAVAAERARVATEGWGAELLARQNPNGSWGDDGEYPWWQSTMDTAVRLMEFGLDPHSPQARGMAERLSTWDFGEYHNHSPFFEGESEPCINGRVLAVGAYFGRPSERLMQRLLSEQLADGGWNCEAERGSVRASFHSTICVMEGLLEYKQNVADSPEIAASLKRAEEFLLARHLTRSLSTGKPITLDRMTNKPTTWTKLAFPLMWHYDVLRAMEYFRRAGGKPDPRLKEGAQLVAKRMHQNNRWPRNIIYRDPAQLEMEGAKGTASRWITLRSLRVLDWFKG